MKLADPAIEYNADIQGQVYIKSIDVYRDLPCKISVIASDKSPITYTGDLTGYIIMGKIEREDGFYNFDGRINVESTIYGRNILPGSVDIDKEYTETSFDAITSLPGTHFESTLYSYVNYIKQDKNIDIPSQINVIYSYNKDLEGSLYILETQYNHSLLTTLFVPEFPVDNLPDIDSTVNLPKRPVENDIYAAMAFEPRTYNNKDATINGTVWIPKWKSSNDIPSRMWVPWYGLEYTINSTIQVEYGLNYYLNSKIDVTNDQIYDIDGTTTLSLSTYENNELEGTVELPPFQYKDIEGNVTLDPTYTFHELAGIIQVVPPFDTDLECSMYVTSDYTRKSCDITSFVKIGKEESTDIISSIQVNPAAQQPYDLLSSVFVSNELSPTRVGIFVDPLWKYEPFILKNTISTFLDRIYSKSFITLVYSGSPRANWDIKHFANIYRIPPYRSIEVPFDFLPGNPMMNRDQMIRYINMLFRFGPNDEYRTVDKIFLFSDNPYTHNASYLGPLLALSERYNIPVTIINSQGEFSGVDPTGYINRPIGPNACHPHRPYPPCGVPGHHQWQMNPDSKHRNIFDDDEIV